MLKMELNFKCEENKSKFESHSDTMLENMFFKKKKKLEKKQNFNNATICNKII